MRLLNEPRARSTTNIGDDVQGCGTGPRRPFSGDCDLQYRFNANLRSAIPAWLQAKEMQSWTPRFRQRFLLSDSGVLAQERLASCRLPARVGHRICPHIEQSISDLDTDPRIPNYHAVPEPGLWKIVPKVRLAWCWREIFGEQIQLCVIPGNECAHKVRDEVPRPSLNLNGLNRIRERPVGHGCGDRVARQPKAQVASVQAHETLTKAHGVSCARRTLDCDVHSEHEDDDGQNYQTDAF